MENINDMEVVEQAEAAEEYIVTFDEDTTEATEARKKITAAEAGVVAGAAAVTGIIGFLAGKSHEAKVQKALLEKVSTVLDGINTDISLKFGEAQEEVIKRTNEDIGTEVIELSKKDLQSSANLILSEISSLKERNKFNIFAKKREAQWVNIHQKLLATIMLYDKLIEVQSKLINELNQQSQPQSKPKPQK